MQLEAILAIFGWSYFIDMSQATSIRDMLSNEIIMKEEFQILSGKVNLISSVC